MQILPLTVYVQDKKPSFYSFLSFQRLGGIDPPVETALR
ncbi:hypothetical protein CU035_1406 [Enterococcus faecium]|nr:hypothetical protein [Enterococcus faecium]MBK4805530.1 hypothetical protein [Enterococcus faecium]MBK4818242.1 hypothetical protein [Enterococcus faecium]MBK4867374.1 hypothetical protein [Enterococcus faecium]